MGLIDRATVDRIYAAADIVEIIGDYVTLKRKGVNYQACCPFHNEKTPSFVVSPSKGVFKCFGCGKAGNAVTFVMEHEGISYPEALKAVAKRYGIEVQERELTEEDIRRAVNEYSVFGRVTPQQKLSFVKALKAQGHTVAMTGDGVNDVLALKEADCSIAMASGSDAARTVSSLVLLDSNFASMPVVVQEGRRSINNLQRSSSLFLAKTIFSALIAVLFIFINYSYPFQPVQQTLISTLTIGTPSFILALEPNKDRLRGKFILNVIRQSIPAALTMTANIVLLCALSGPLGLSNQDMSTLAVVLTCLTGFIMLFKISTPFNGLRGALFGVLLAAFVASVLFLSEFFALTTLTLPMLIALVPILLFSIALMLALTHLVDHVIANSQSPLRQLGKRKGRRRKA